MVKDNQFIQKGHKTMNILTSEDLQNILKIGERQAKALMRTKGFPSRKIGREYRVTESALQQWLDNTKSVKLDYSKC